MTSTALYRLFDRQGRLLYVGISRHFVARFEQHASEKPWWSEVVGTTVEHFESRELAEIAERAAIKSENPVHNWTHTDRQRQKRVAALLSAPNMREIKTTLTDEQYEQAMAMAKAEGRSLASWLRCLIRDALTEQIPAAS